MRNILACKARRFVLLAIGVLVATGAWTAPAFQAPGRAAPGGVASAVEAAIAEVEVGRKKPRVLDWLIARQAIESTVAVFVDSHGDDHLADAACTEVPEGHNQAAWRNHLRIVLVGLSGSTQQERFPVLEGPYFNQAPPGDVPQRLAPGFLSTAGYDLTPTFSPALDEVFFGRRPTEDGSDNRIFHSRMVNGRWQRPTPASFSSGAVEFEAQFSVDGNTLYFNRGKLMYFSRRTDTGWSEARAIDPPADEGMCIAAARNGTLYFTAARNRVYGIFRSQRVDGRYQVPEIAIPMAAHPWVAPDESYLVFDKYAFSEGAQTSKLLVAFRLKDGTWSAPIELDKNINATGTELIAKMSPRREVLFFQRKVNGNTDIYWVDAKVIDAVRDSTGRK